jgi:hypothetical protein
MFKADSAPVYFTIYINEYSNYNLSIYHFQGGVYSKLNIYLITLCQTFLDHVVLRITIYYIINPIEES